MVIECQKKKIITDLLSLPITGCQIVLGANWLSTLGDIVWNFQELTMKYEKNGVMQQFKGVQNSSAQLKEPGSKDLRQKGQFYIIQLCSVGGTQEKLQDSKEDVAVVELLQKYEMLFDEPRRLPPKRELDHRIPLLAVCSRPYRHPYVHKCITSV